MPASLTPASNESAAARACELPSDLSSALMHDYLGLGIELERSAIKKDCDARCILK